MTSDSRPFQSYAAAYDHLYHEKDYAAECSFIEEMATAHSRIKVQSILDLGCGTGGHAIPLAAKGYSVAGTDLSGEMLNRARAKAEQAGVANLLSWHEGDLANIHLGQRFDMVICMFAVLSYQTSNEQLLKSFAAVREHLNPGGIFVCDFWYGPAALRDLPAPREKWVTDDKIRIHRAARPEIDFNSNVVHVAYDVTTYEGEEIVDQASERHAMRYLFLPELALMGKLHGLELTHSCDCCKASVRPGEKTWTVSAIFHG
jgi:SAM-dependent methyltransferase